MIAKLTVESLDTVLSKANSIKEVLLTFVEDKFIEPFKKELCKYETKGFDSK